MVRSKAISIALLCLFLAVSWHNTFFHTHESGEKHTSYTTHQHHHTEHHHHHESTPASWQEWLGFLLGDIEHPDMGSRHFQAFLQPIGKVLTHQLQVVDTQGDMFTPPTAPQRFYTLTSTQKVPVAAASLSDPPFLNTSRSRGPPLYS